MVVIGADVHKRTHTFVAIDDAGRKIGEKAVSANTPGHGEVLRWATSTFPAALWGIEDCRNLSLRLERDLLAAGQQVVRVPPMLTAWGRRRSRRPGKSDPLDALAVARAVLREPDLPVATHDEVAREMQLLVDRRDDLVGRRIELTNRLLGRVHEIDPDHIRGHSGLCHAKRRDALREWLHVQTGLQAELALAELDEITGCQEATDALEKRLAARVRTVAPALLAIQGCGIVSAATLVGESANVDRFKDEAAFASFGGLAPIARWSGGCDGRVVMSSRGNRRVQRALYRIATTQVRMKDSPGAAYYKKRREAGDPPAKAMRCLKRRIARVVFHRLRSDYRKRVDAAASETADMAVMRP